MRMQHTFAAAALTNPRKNASPSSRKTPWSDNLRRNADSPSQSRHQPITSAFNNGGRKRRDQRLGVTKFCEEYVDQKVEKEADS
jgi:hypothetical protein